MTPALIGIDWGSSNLRAALLDAQGVLIEHRESAEGVFTVQGGDFASVLWRLCGDWIAQHPVPLWACGMIGSRQGIVEVPYVACPAGVRELARALGHATLAPREQPAAAAVTLAIVPGLKCGSAAAGWDVLRGEETQCLGLAAAGPLCVLPGTHSKWMLRRRDGQVDAFQTYMTGELFDLLHRQGSLARMMAPAQWSPDAFEQGVQEAHDDTLENLLFRVRTAGLMARFAADALPDYLSGLLIGAEVKAGLGRFGSSTGGEPITLVGTAPLTRRYAIAMTLFGRTAREHPGDAVFAGLAAIARAARAAGLPTRGVAPP